MPKEIVLDEFDSKELIAKYGIRTTKQKLCSEKGINDAIKFANSLGYPVVVKVVSPDIIHKTEAGIVHTHIHNESELRADFEEVLRNAKKYDPKARVTGVLVQEQARGAEVIIGSAKDPVFGRVLMFGIGGILVEHIKDVQFRKLPITEKDAEDMIARIEHRSFLEKSRGVGKVNENAIKKMLMQASKMLSERPDILELDLNPVIVNKNDAIAVDARIKVEAGKR